MTLALVLLIALGMTSSLALIARGATHQAPRPPLSTRSATANLLRKAGLNGADPTGRTRLRNAAIGTAVGAVAWLISGWFVMLPAGPVIGVLLPVLVSKPAGVDNIKLMTALETWCRSLAGLFTGANVSPEMAIESSLASTPPELEKSVARVVSRLARRRPLEESMRVWAAELKNPHADEVALAIIQGAQLRQGGIATSLSALANSLSKRLEAEHDNATEREGPLTTIRWITVIFGAFLLIGMLNPAYAEPYRTPGGQVVLAALIAGFLAALFWLRQIGIQKPQDRLLADRQVV